MTSLKSIDEGTERLWGIKMGEGAHYEYGLIYGPAVVLSPKTQANAQSEEDMDYLFVLVPAQGSAGKWEFVCAGNSNFGQKLCKSLCGFASCNMDTKQEWE